MYGFLYLDVLHVHTAIRRINICMLPLFGCIACSYSNRKENKHMYWLPLFGCIACSYSNCKENKQIRHVHTAIVRIINICMASFIWMYCIFIQQL